MFLQQLILSVVEESTKQGTGKIAPSVVYEDIWAFLFQI